MRPVRAGFRHVRAGLRPERGARRLNSWPNERLGRVNLRPEMPELSPERKNFECWEDQFEA